MRIHNPVITGSLVVSGSISTEGQPAGTVASASYAVSASYAPVEGFPYTGSAAISGSLNVNGPITASSYSGDGSGLSGVAGFPHTGSGAITGSLAVTGSVGFTYFNAGIIDTLSTWASTTAMNAGGNESAHGGTHSDAFSAGGDFPALPICCTEVWNGTTWSGGGNLPNNYYQTAGAGTSNAGLQSHGGCAPTYGFSYDSNEYNGTSWSAGGSVIQAITQLSGTGTQNAALMFAGFGGDCCTEEYNGTAWASGGQLINSSCRRGSAGTVNAGLAFGGFYAYQCTEHYDGTVWSSGGTLINARCGLAGGGTQNQALAIGGYAPGGPASNSTEIYDGTTWTATGNLITARQKLGAAVTPLSKGLAFGGGGTCTEEMVGESSINSTFGYSSTTGETTVSCLIETSAARYKDNIQPMGSQLNKVMQLKPVEFNWKSNKKQDIGFVADSVKNVYPNLVSERDGKVEGMNYSKLVSALVKSIQEQQEQINNLKARLDNNK